MKVSIDVERDRIAVKITDGEKTIEKVWTPRDGYWEAEQEDWHRDMASAAMVYPYLVADALHDLAPKLLGLRNEIRSRDARISEFKGTQ